jgi:hypothetical protein
LAAKSRPTPQNEAQPLILRKTENNRKFTENRKKPDFQFLPEKKSFFQKEDILGRVETFRAGKIAKKISKKKRFRTEKRRGTLAQENDLPASEGPGPPVGISPRDPASSGL